MLAISCTTKKLTYICRHNHSIIPDMTSKEKLVTILQNIIQKGRSGAKIESKAFASIIGEENFDKKIKEKIFFFNNIPEESKIFSIFYDTAKRSLDDLKKNIINIHAFELVKLFYTLDDFFLRNLTPVKHRDENIETETTEQKTFCEEIKEKIVVSEQKKIIELPEGITGIEFLSAKVMDQKSFNDLNEALENL